MEKAAAMARVKRKMDRDIQDRKLESERLQKLEDAKMAAIEKEREKLR